MTAKAVSRALAFAPMWLAFACGPSPKTPPPSAPLHLSPTTDLAPAADLVWLFDAKPRAIFSRVDAAHAIAQVVDDAQFRHFQAENAGVDPRELEEFVVAKYPKTTLFLARGALDPARIEQTFSKTIDIEGRGVDRNADALGTITRAWGTTPSNEREQIAIFGREVVAVERGQFGPLRTAELFAEERLKRASPALRTDPLAQAAARFSDAPLVAYAAGPFEDAWKHALGGLLAAATAAAIAVRFLDSDHGHDGDRMAITIALYGSWGRDADAAASRLTAAIHLIQESSIGKLCGVDHPAVGPTPRASESEIAVDLTVDAEVFFRGLRDATSAGPDEIFGVFGE